MLRRSAKCRLLSVCRFSLSSPLFATSSFRSEPDAFAIFAIPVCNGEEAAEDLNRFLGTHRVVAIDRQFVHDGENSVWALCVTYVQTANRPPTGRRGKIDYREVLSEADFTV